MGFLLAYRPEIPGIFGGIDVRNAHFANACICAAHKIRNRIYKTMNPAREDRKSENARETDGPALFIMPVRKITGDALCTGWAVKRCQD